LGKGSEFCFKMAFDEGDETQFDDGKSTIYNIIDNLEDLHLLLVEDNKINQLVATKFLKQWKVKFDIADNGRTAIDLAQKHKFDMILMDLQMPVMDGIAATQEIRKLPGYHFVPIIALTAASLESEDEVHRAGMNDFLIKPFNPIELYNAIKKYAISDQKYGLVGKENEQELDLSVMRRISDGDTEFLLKLIKMCQEQFDSLPVQLLAAIKNKSIIEARNIIHKINPSVKMLQYYQLEKITLEINNLLKHGNQDMEVVEKKACEFNGIIDKVQKMLSDKENELNNKLCERQINES
jgi:CheY-like chemotaxis protein